MNNHDEEGSWHIPPEKQLVVNQSIMDRISLLGSDFDKERPEATTDKTWNIRLEAQAEMLAEIIRWTKLEPGTFPYAAAICNAWTKMEIFTGLERDFGVLEHLQPVIQSERASGLYCR